METAPAVDITPSEARSSFRSIDGVCLRPDETVYFFMNPARYFARVEDRLTGELVVRQVQNTFRSLSQNYFNGYGEKVFARDFKYLIQLLATDEFRREVEIDHFLTRLDLQNLAEVNQVDLEVVEAAMETVFPVLCERMDDRKNTLTPSTTTLRTVYPYQELAESYPAVDATYSRLQSALQPIERLLASFVIHGSLSTLDFTRYSDVDTMVYIDDHVFRSKGLLRTCRRGLTRAAAHLFEYDPLQHHRFFISPAANLGYYPESYLPLAVLSEATALIGPRQLHITPRPSIREVLTSLWSLCHDFRVWFLSENHPTEPFDLKRYTSRLMILPTLMLEAFHDLYLYKRDSFARARSYFSREAWRAIKIATRLREQWIAGQQYEVSPSFFKASFLLAEEILQQLQTFKSSDTAPQLYELS